MNVEESIKTNPAKFEELLDSKVPFIEEALKDLSSKLDIIFSGALREYCRDEQVEFDINDIRSYKTMNKIITGKLDAVIGEYIKEKRSTIE